MTKPVSKVIIRLRMCDADRDEYGGPEWVAYDHARVEDMRASELIDIETTIGMPISQLVDELAAEHQPAVALKALLWLARRMAGLVDDWPAFDPHVQRRQLTIRQMVVPVAGDADPPDSSSTPPADGPAGSPPTTPGDCPPAPGSSRSAPCSPPSTGSHPTD